VYGSKLDLSVTVEVDVRVDVPVVVVEMFICTPSEDDDSSDEAKLEPGAAAVDEVESLSGTEKVPLAMGIEASDDVPVLPVEWLKKMVLGPGQELVKASALDVVSEEVSAVVIEADKVLLAVPFSLFAAVTSGTTYVVVFAVVVVRVMVVVSSSLVVAISDLSELDN